MKLCHSRPARRALGLTVVFFLVFFLTSVASLPADAAEKTRLRVDDYQIDVELLPQTHKLAAHATVKATALEDLSVATFQLNNGLRITKLTDANNKPLTPERNTQDSTVRFALTSGLAKNTSTTFYFEYEGTLESADDSPVPGLKLAYIGPDTSYLLYSGLWFPVAGYGVNRFTATINVTVPAHMVVIGSGKEPAATALAAANPKKPATALANAKTFTFTWDTPSFPGTIIAGTFQEFKSDEAGIDLHVFFKPNHQALGAEYASTAVKAFTYFVTQYGLAPSARLKIVELPDDTVPTAWAPEIAALSSRAITEKVNYRLLANTIAHQWWGVSVSPAS
ncbi:MAG: peptidase M1, partial [Terriglobales bacterium]